MQALQYGQPSPYNQQFGPSQQQSFIPQQQSFIPQQQSFIPQQQSFGPQQPQFIPQQQSFGPQFIPQQQSFGPQLISPQQSFGPQPQSFGQQPQSFGQQQQSFGPSNQMRPFKNARSKMNDKYKKTKAKAGNFYRKYKKPILIGLFIIVCIIVILVSLKLTGKLGFTPARDTLLSKEALKPNVTMLDKKILKLKIKNNKGSGLSLNHASANNQNSVNAYPEDLSGAKTWVYNPNDYSLCTTSDGLCLYNKVNDSTVMIKNHEKNNADFKWNINFDKQTIIKNDTNLALDNNTLNNVIVSDATVPKLTQQWSFDVIN